MNSDLCASQIWPLVPGSSEKFISGVQTYFNPTRTTMMGGNGVSNHNWDAATFTHYNNSNQGVFLEPYSSLTRKP